MIVDISTVEFGDRLGLTTLIEQGNPGIVTASNPRDLSGSPLDCVSSVLDRASMFAQLEQGDTEIVDTRVDATGVLRGMQAGFAVVDFMAYGGSWVQMHLNGHGGTSAFTKAISPSRLVLRLPNESNGGREAFRLVTTDPNPDALQPRVAITQVAVSDRRVKLHELLNL